MMKSAKPFRASHQPGMRCLVTIEFEPQTPGADGTNLSLSTDAHTEVADRLRIFASQAAAKHGHFPANWLLGSLFAEKYAHPDQGKRDAR